MMRRKYVTALLLGMSISLATPIPAVMAANESVEDSKDNSSTEEKTTEGEVLSFQDKLPEMKNSITTGLFGSESEAIKEKIEKQIKTPDESILSLSDFLEVLISDYVNEKKSDYKTADQIVNEAAKIYGDTYTQEFYYYYSERIMMLEVEGKITESVADKVDDALYKAKTLKEIKAALDSAKEIKETIAFNLPSSLTAGETGATTAGETGGTTGGETGGTTGGETGGTTGGETGGTTGSETGGTTGGETGSTTGSETKPEDVTEDVDKSLSKEKEKQINLLDEKMQGLNLQSTAVMSVDNLLKSKIRECATLKELEEFCKNTDSIINQLKTSLEKNSSDSVKTLLDMLQEMSTSPTETKKLLDYFKTKCEAMENPLDVISEAVDALLEKSLTEYKLKLYEKLESIVYENNLSQNDDLKKILQTVKNLLEKDDSLGDYKDVYNAYETAIEKIQEQILKIFSEKETAKAALDKLLDNITEKELKAAVQTIINNGKEKIDQALDSSSIGQIVKEIEEAIKKEIELFESDQTLYKKKFAATEALNSLIPEKESTFKDEVKKIVEEALKNIESAKDVKSVDEILDKARDEITKEKKLYEIAEALKKDKESAIKELDELGNEQNDSDFKSIVKNIVDNYKKLIDKAETTDSVKELLKNAKTEIEATKKAYDTDKKLTIAKVEAKEKLDAIAAGKKISSKLSEILSEAKMNIDEAKDVTAVNNLFNEAKDSFEEQYIKELRARYVEKINKLLSASQETGSVLSEIKETVNKAVDNINKATSEEVMESVYENTKTSIERIESEAEASLKKKKTNAINELNNATTLTTTEAKKIISSYTNKINSAKDEEEVDRYLTEAKSLLDKLNKESGATAKTNSTTSSSSGKSSTISQTSSDAGKDSGKEATGKTDSSAEGKSAVKTGDENGFSIFTSITAIVICLSAIAGLIYKKLKK